LFYAVSEYSRAIVPGLNTKSGKGVSVMRESSASRFRLPVAGAASAVLLVGVVEARAEDPHRGSRLTSTPPSSAELSVTFADQSVDVRYGPTDLENPVAVLHHSRVERIELHGDARFEALLLRNDRLARRRQYRERHVLLKRFVERHNAKMAHYLYVEGRRVPEVLYLDDNFETLGREIGRLNGNWQNPSTLTGFEGSPVNFITLLSDGVTNPRLSQGRIHRLPLPIGDDDRNERKKRDGGAKDSVCTSMALLAFVVGYGISTYGLSQYVEFSRMPTASLFVSSGATLIYAALWWLFQ
jgi:hypothetical protein